MRLTKTMKYAVAALVVAGIYLWSRREFFTDSQSLGVAIRTDPSVRMAAIVGGVLAVLVLGQFLTRRSNPSVPTM